VLLNTASSVQRSNVYIRLIVAIYAMQPVRSFCDPCTVH